MKEQNKKWWVIGAIILIIILINNAQSIQTPTFAAYDWVKSITSVIPWLVGLFIATKVSGGSTGFLGLSSFAWVIIALAVILIFSRRR